jgi:hypothetical protein
MGKRLEVTTHAEQAARERERWRNSTQEERLAEVERLRLEAGKFLYEYPRQFRRVASITRREKL